MADKIYIGANAASLEKSPALTPYTGVTVFTINADGDRIGYSAGIVDGVNAGRVLEIECPWPTQTMADDLYNRVAPASGGTRAGYIYQPYSASGALLDPAAELGDAIIIGDVYGVLARQDTDHTGGGAADIGAENVDDIDDEYPYQNPVARSINALRSATAELRVNAENIEARVDGAEGDISSISIAVDGIHAQVTDAQGNYTVLNQTATGVIVKGNGGEIVINGGQFKAGTVTADSVRADTLIQSPTIYGAEYYSENATGRLVLEERLQTGTYFPSLIYSNASSAAHEVFRIDDLYNADVVKAVFLGDDAFSYWKGTAQGSFLQMDTALWADIFIPAHGYNPPSTPGQVPGQIYFEIVG